MERNLVKRSELTIFIVEDKGTLNMSWNCIIGDQVINCYSSDSTGKDTLSTLLNMTLK